MYINDSLGTYGQIFPQLDIDGGTLASGQILTGTVSGSFADFSPTYVAGQTDYEFGLILNGDGANQTVFYDNITFSITTAPEPGFAGILAIAGLGLLRRKR